MRAKLEKTESNLKTEVRGHGNRRQKRTSFYVGLSGTSVDKSCDNRVKCDCDIQVVVNRVNQEIKDCVIQVVRQSIANNGLNRQLLANKVTKTLDNTHGKRWNCIVGDNLFHNSIGNLFENYIKLSLSSTIDVVIFRTDDLTNTAIPSEVRIYYSLVKMRSELLIGIRIMLKGIKTDQSLDT